LEDHRTPTPEGGLDLVPGIGGIEAVGESFYREALVAVTRGQRHNSPVHDPEPDRRFTRS
jgi:hypothetical protein